MDVDADLSSRYCLRRDYVVNPVATTRDDVSSGGYWDVRRIAASAHYQFSVYKLGLRLAQQRNASSILDVGCGTGSKLAYIHARAPDVRIIGIDQPSAVEYCRTTHSFGEWLAEDLDEPDPRNALLRADIVICADVIEHVWNPDRLMDYLRARCSVGGVIILSTPERERLRGQQARSSPNPQHVREWAFEELGRYVRSLGFRVLKHYCTWPVRITVSKWLVAEVRGTILKGHSLRYNQICVLTPSG